MPRKQSLRETPPRKFEAEGSRIDAHGLESRDPIEPGAGGRGVYLVQSKGIGGVDLGDWSVQESVLWVVRICSLFLFALSRTLQVESKSRNWMHQLTVVWTAN